MLGSFEDAEDLVQETFLRAWRSRATFTFQSAMSFRAWLYRIATNLCLDRLERRPRRVLPSEVGPAADPRAGLQPPADLPWLQPYPDRLLEDVSPSDTTPDEAVVSKETIELTFLAAIQFLPPRQRAVLIVRDVLDWSAKETASLLGSSVASVNSALQRARATLKTRLPASRLEWSAAADRSAAERQLLRRYIDAYESGDLTELADVLREDARLIMPPYLEWYFDRRLRSSLLGSGRPRLSRQAARRTDARQQTARGRLVSAALTGPDVPSALAGRAPNRGRDRRRDHRFRPPRPVRGLRARADPLKGPASP